MKCQFQVTPTQVIRPSGPYLGESPRLFFVRLRGFVLYSFLPPLSAVRILYLDQTKSLALRYPTFRQILSAVAHLEHLSIYGDMVPPGVIHFPEHTYP
jgi:hypothetical protein